MSGAVRSIVRLRDADDFNEAPSSHVNGNVHSIDGDVSALLGMVRAGGKSEYCAAVAVARTIASYEHTLYVDLTSASFDLTLPKVPRHGELHHAARTDTTAARTFRFLDAAGTVVYTSGSTASKVWVTVQFDGEVPTWRVKCSGTN